MTFNNRADNMLITKGHSFVFSMDGACLLIKVKGQEYACPLSAADTHRLLNLLWINRKDIIQANIEAQRYRIQPYPENRKGRRKGQVESL